MIVVTGLKGKLGVGEDEGTPLLSGFLAFTSALAGYFMLVPLRDEAGLALGIDKLPSLFLGSLVLILLATPLASAFLHQFSARERALQLLFRMLSASILGFALLFLATGSPPSQPLWSTYNHLAAEEQQMRHLQAAAGAVPLTRAQAGIRAAFYPWVGVINLVSVSCLWARSADIFTPDQSRRLFGLLGAGATLGQLLGSLLAGALVKAPLLGGGGAEEGQQQPSVLPLLAAAAAMELAGQAVRRYRVPVKQLHGGTKLPPDLESDSGTAARPPRGGSLSQQGSRGWLAGLAAEGADDPWQAARGGVAGLHPIAKDASRMAHRPGENSGLLRRLLGPSCEGFHLIWASQYLLHICAYLALNYVASSFFYFQKALVVGRVHDAAGRTAWFAAINSTSALCILGLQVLATGRVLHHLGLPLALSILPTAAGLLMACVAAWPVPSAVAAAEVTRKILAYSLARPARESLFTVVTRAEKYKAKIFMDTIVQRVGDACAAAAFQALGPLLGFGPSQMALACIPVCALWAVVAYRLGRRQQRLAGGSTKIAS